MKKRVLLWGIMVVLSVQLFAQSFYNDLNKNGKMDLYEDPAAPTAQRVEHLVSLMTLEEKVGQLQMTMGWEYYDRHGEVITISEKFKKDLQTLQLGSTWALQRADPWTKKDFENGIDAEKSFYLTQEMQKYVREHTRLGIPFFFAEECPHGLMALDATVFPTAIGRASTFNVDLENRVGQCVEREAHSRGAHILFGPVVDIARDPCWSRMEEGYGEDPHLTAQMSNGYMAGLQQSGLISTMKHFSAYGTPEGGHNGASAHVGRRELLSVLSYPFWVATKNGLKSLMTSYNDVDGIPCNSNKWLLKEILRNRWNFQGLIISDLFAINGLVGFRVAADYTEAAALAIKAGINIDLGASCYGKPLIEAFKKGLVTEEEIDAVLKPVLTAKFEQGLFDKTYDDKFSKTEDASLIAMQAAIESVVLLKNDQQILPLSKQLKRVAVLGPNADNGYNMLGDYTAPQKAEYVTTLLEGVRKMLPEAKVEYVKGCAIRDTSATEIEKAVRAAQQAEVVIMALGGSSARDFNTQFKETGAAEVAKQQQSDMESGEGFDRATLSMMGDQQKLLEAVCATGKPVVLVMIQGRPLNLTWAKEKVPAILNAWYPGGCGGEAVAKILFGEETPSGHLPVTYPSSAEQLPIYYNTTSERHDYTDASAKPLYPFGYGLSYTSFQYSEPTISQVADTMNISFYLTNTGNYSGAEVVQLYMKDDYSSVVLPEYQLKKFKKVFLHKGEQTQITFKLTDEDFMLFNEALQWVLEQGTYTLQIGSHFGDKKIEITTRK